MNHIDLFCGPGGFATGFEWSGFETLLGVDIHAPSLNTFAHNHKKANVLLGDIREIESKKIQALSAKKINVLSAGVPCEGFSMSNRNRLKFTDERNFLFIEFLRIAEDLKPDVLLVENVANFARHDEGFFGKEVEAGMSALGYQTTSNVINACDYGVPQRRRRVMFVGMKKGLNFKWPKITHGLDENLLDFVTVGQAILGDLPPLESNEQSEKYLGAAKNPYQKFIRGSQKKLLNHQAPKHPQETIERISNTLPGQPMYESFKQRIRLHPDHLSPTIVSGGIRPQFAYGHPTQPRGMSIRERARLMSFPDWYEFLGGIVQGRVQTGDAVPPLMAKAVAAEIANSLNGFTKKSESQLGLVHIDAVQVRQKDKNLYQYKLDI